MDIKGTIEKEYSGHEDLSKLLDSVDDIEWLAKMVTWDEYGNNKELSKKLCDTIMTTTDSIDSLVNILDLAQDEDCINDAAYAKEVVSKAISIADNSSDKSYYLKIADCVTDIDMARELYLKSLEAFEDEEGDFDNYQWLGLSISQRLEDKALAKDVLTKGLNKFPMSENYRSVAQETGDKYNDMHDKEWTKELLEKAYSTAKSSNDYREIANVFIDAGLYDPEDDDDEKQINWLSDLYILALVLTDDKDDKKFIKKEMKENNMARTAKYIKDRGAELLKDMDK